MSKLGPPMAARALAIAHTCMYDAWAAYDQDAVGTTDLGGQRRRPPGERHNDNKKQAISFAAYRCLVNLFADSDLFPATGANAALRLAAVMVSQGYDPTNNSTVTTTPDGIGIPAAIGNVAARAVIDARSGDGSNQYGDLYIQLSPIQPIRIIQVTRRAIRLWVFAHRCSRIARSWWFMTRTTGSL